MADEAERLTYTGQSTPEGRAIYSNQYGDFVTERTITEYIPSLGGYVNIPTVLDGRFLPPDMAISMAMSSGTPVDPVTGRKLDVFSDVDVAVESAVGRSGGLGDAIGKPKDTGDDMKFSEFLTDVSESRFSEFLPENRPRGAPLESSPPGAGDLATPGGVSQPSNQLLTAAGGGDLANSSAPTPEDFGYEATISPQEAFGLAASLMSGPVGFLGQIGNFASRDMAANRGLVASPNSGLRGLFGNTRNMMNQTSNLNAFNAFSGMTPGQQQAEQNAIGVGLGLAGSGLGFGGGGDNGGGGVGGEGFGGAGSDAMGGGFGDAGNSDGGFGGFA